MSDTTREWVLWILGIIISFGLGAMTTWVASVRDKRDKEPCYDVRNLSFLRDYSAPVAGLDVSYKGKQVRSLSVSKVVIWNRGRASIDGSDLVQSDPLRIVGRGNVQILGVRRLIFNHDANGFTAQLREQSAYLTFEYLDRGHGAVFQVVHDGESAQDLAIKGSVKGVSSFQRIRVEPISVIPSELQWRLRRGNRWTKLVMKLMEPHPWSPWLDRVGTAVLTLLTLIGIFLFIGPTDKMENDPLLKWALLAAMVLAWVSVLVPAILGRMLPSLPEDLDNFLDDNFGWEPEPVIVKGSLATATAAAHAGTVRSPLLIECLTLPELDGGIEAITHLGGAGWRLTVAEVVNDIEEGRREYYIQDSAEKRSVAGVRVSETGRKFIQTYSDGYWNNRLLGLPKCK